MKIRFILVTTVFVLTSILAPQILLASDPSFSIQKEQTIRDILENQVGHYVKVKLDSGEELGGMVKTIGANVLHITELSGRDYFDAVIRIESIDAIIVKARDK